MRFYRGEVYQCESANGLRKAIVVDLSDDGQKATLRPFDNDPEFTAVWAELCLTGKWKRTEAEGVAN